MIETIMLKLPGRWSLRKLVVGGSSQWALQYMGMDWYKIEEFMPSEQGASFLDEEMKRFADDMNALSDHKN